MIIFLICLSVRIVEYFLIETDKTAIGENVLHKVVGIIFLALALKKINLTWRDIGFQRNGFVSGILKGLLCVLFNVINVWMEEGVFRGLFIKTLSETTSFMPANCIAAFLFGIWHIVMPIRSYTSGELSFAAMVLMSIGYVILSGIMGIKWGLLYRMTGTIWVGLGDHLFNNTVATNMLHVISLTGADELQIVRIMVAQLISFAFVLVLYVQKQKSKYSQHS